jgi:hypothetical protein
MGAATIVIVVVVLLIVIASFIMIAWGSIKRIWRKIKELFS